MYIFCYRLINIFIILCLYTFSFFFLVLFFLLSPFNLLLFIYTQSTNRKHEYSRTVCCSFQIRPSMPNPLGGFRRKTSHAQQRQTRSGRLPVPLSKICKFAETQKYKIREKLNQEYLTLPCNFYCLGTVNGKRKVAEKLGVLWFYSV